MKYRNQKGFSLVELLVVVIIIAIVAAIAIPNLLASRRAANEAAAASALRTIHSAEVTYQATLGGGTNFATLATLATAGAGNLLDGSFSAGSPVTKTGYKFTEQATPTTTYCVHAEPTSAATGTRNFGVGTDGVIYYGAAALTCTAGVVGGGTVLGN